jgi:hypothetical protein
VFLQAQFDADDRFSPPEIAAQRCLILSEWPSGNLPPRALSILCAGERRDTHLTAEVVKVTDKPNGKGEFTWTIKAISQPLQLDVWAQTDAERGMILDALDRFLNMGPLFTLGYGDITRDGPLLKLDPLSGHEGFLDFLFEGPRPIYDGQAAHESEFRSTIRGQVDTELTFTATTAKLVRVKLQSLLDGNPFNFNLTKNAAGNGFDLAPAT